MSHIICDSFCPINNLRYSSFRPQSVGFSWYSILRELDSRYPFKVLVKSLRNFQIRVDFFYPLRFFQKSLYYKVFFFEEKSLYKVCFLKKNTLYSDFWKKMVTNFCQKSCVWIFFG